MECKLIPLLRYSSLVLLFLAISAQADSLLVPNYDIASSELKIFDVKGPLVLSCNVTKDGNYVLSWSKNNTDVSEIESLKERYEINTIEHKFIIKRALETDAGTYKCSVKELGEERSIVAYAQVAVKLPSNTAVVEGEKLTIPCVVVGTNPIISWKVGNTTYTESADRYILQENENHIKNAWLIVEETILDDRGEFTCEASNIASKALDKTVQSTTMVRVKGKFAALWPFLGICAEVFVLCAIILIYEKRRNKTDLEESDTDQSPDQKNDHQAKDSDVRQRK